jgi:phage terminase large subunit-like protein
MHGFVLDDRSDMRSPVETCDEIISLHGARQANKVVAETNQGLGWIEALLRSRDGGRSIAYDGVHAREGKRLRAEPISSLYAQGRVHHVGMHAKLEDEMVNWDPKVTLKSPNRIDALVHGLTALMISEEDVPTARITVGYAR